MYTITAAATLAYHVITAYALIDPGILFKLGINSTDILTKIYEYALIYTDGYILISSWSWAPEKVANGEEAGCCIR